MPVEGINHQSREIIEGTFASEVETDKRSVYVLLQALLGSARKRRKAWRRSSENENRLRGDRLARLIKEKTPRIDVPLAGSAKGGKNKQVLKGH